MNTKLLRSKVLQLAISGSLVPQDPNDEPAIALLHRINPKFTPEQTDNPLPPGWTWCQIKNVCLFENGYAFNSQDYKEEGTPIIRISDIVDNKIELNKCVHYQGNVDDRFCISKGDLLIALSGATTGKMGVYLSDKKAYLNQRVGNLKVIDTTAFLPDYRNLFMQSKVDEILKLAYGSAQPNISGKTISDFTLPLPPLAEQERIVKEVERWFANIEQLERSQEALGKAARQTKRHILSLAISGRLVPQDPNDEPASELLKRINPKFTPQPTEEPLPSGWTSCKLGELVNIISGVSYAKGDVTTKGIRILRGGNIQDGAILTYDDDVFLGEQYANSTNSVYKGDIVMVASTGSFIALGKTGYCIEDMENTQIGAFLRIIRAKYKALASFLNLFFLSDAFRKHIRNKAKGTNINNIKGSYITDYVIPLPPLAEQERIVQKVEELFAVLDALQ